MPARGSSVEVADWVGGGGGGRSGWFALDERE